MPASAAAGPSPRWHPEVIGARVLGGVSLQVQLHAGPELSAPIQFSNMRITAAPFW